MTGPGGGLQARPRRWHWEGKAATEFRALMSDEMRPRVEDAYLSFSEASRAFDRWLNDLDDFQRRADLLEQEAERARESMTLAQSLLDGLGDPPEGGDKTAADRYHDDKTRHASALSSSQGDLDDVLRRARLLADEASGSSQTAAGALHTAMKAAPDEPGLWDRFTDALADLGDLLADCMEFIKDNWWDLLHKLVSITASVLAIASLFCPALAPFALGFAIADVAMSGIDWARGVPGAKEAFLTGALGLAGGAVVGKLAGQLVDMAGPALSKGMFSIVASGRTGAIAAPVAATLSYNPQFGPALASYMFVKGKDATDAGDTARSLLGGGETYYSDNLANGWQKARRDSDD